MLWQLFKCRLSRLSLASRVLALQSIPFPFSVSAPRISLKLPWQRTVFTSCKAFRDWRRGPVPLPALARRSKNGKAAAPLRPCFVYANCPYAATSSVSCAFTHQGHAETEANLTLSISIQLSSKHFSFSYS